MKRKLLMTLMLAVVLVWGGKTLNGQATIWLEDFDNNSQYSVTLGGEGSDGLQDYFFRTNGSDINKTYTGAMGSNFFAGQDIDDGGWTGSASPSQLTWSSISISGYSGLQFKGYFASTATTKIDNVDYIHVEYRIDGGAWTNLIWFENDGTTYNTYFLEDTDFNGDGDGTALSGAFSQFTKNIPTTGNTLDLQFTVAVNSGDEDFAIDYFELTGSSGGGNLPPSITNIVHVPAVPLSGELVTVSADVTDSDGTVSSVDLHWGTTSGSLTNTVTMTISSGSTYTGNIPAQTNGTTVFYEIYATDDDADATTSPEQSYTVTIPTNTPPVIANIQQSPVMPHPTDIVTISADVTDSDGTVSSVDLHWGTTSGSLTNTVTMTISSGSTYTGNIPAQTNGTTVFYEIYATDDDADATTSPEQSYTVTETVLVNAWINEFHYDNVSGDVAEIVEVVIENAGSINLADFQVDLYNGNGGVSYLSKTLDAFMVGNTTDGFTFYYYDFTADGGLQNGFPDGLALSYQGTLIPGQFLSYEGSFTATDGPANGVTSTDIGVTESSATAVGESLQLGGTGTSYDAFTWQSPLAETSGAINNNQFFTAPPSATVWTGTTDTDWFDASNWNPGVPGSTTDVTIPAGAPNYPYIPTAAECNNLVMGSDATGDASLMGQANLTVNGTSTVQRYFTDDNWHGLSAPVSGAIANDLYLGGSPEVWAKYYDEAANEYVYVTDLNSPLGDMKGWMVWVGASTPQTFEIHGNLRSGLVGPVALTNSGPGQGDGYNLVGNPFPSTIDWDAASGWFLNNVDGGIWVWNPDGAGGPNFAGYVGGIGYNDGSRYIASGQAFFVQVTSTESSGSIGMNDEVQVPNAVNFMKSQSAISDYVKLKITDGDRYDESIVRFHTQATEGYDSQLDMHKYFSLDETMPQIYSTANNYMSVNALPFGIPSASVDVRGVDGHEFTIELEEVENFAEVYLTDEYLGITTNLMEQPYRFTYEAAQTDRFTVFFSVVGTQENQLDNVQVYSFDKKVRVIIPTQMQAHVEVVNMLGQTVRELDAHMGTQEIDLDHSGYYVVSITDKNQTLTRKVFIK